MIIMVILIIIIIIIIFLVEIYSFVASNFKIEPSLIQHEQLDFKMGDYTFNEFVLDASDTIKLITVIFIQMTLKIYS